MILLKDLDVYNCIGIGGFSNVYECCYNNNDYAYKKYVDYSPVKFIKDKMFKLQIFNDQNIIFPIDFVYAKKNNKLFNGILYECDNNYSNLDYYDCIYYEEKVLILYIIRDLIEYFHKKYNMIHADISPGNILYNDENSTAKLIDLDSSIDMKDKTGYIKKMTNILANNYIKYFGINYELDLYLFNMLTISFLNNINFYDMRKKINEKKICFDNQHINNIINDYRNIGCQKSLKKEYIIDYI